jgi:cytochrome c-type biogenesis protein CcmH/NrfG
VTSLTGAVIALVTLPSLALVLWPLMRGTEQSGSAVAATGADAAIELREDKAAIYRALEELAFDHEAGHLSDDDYAALRQRYEARAAEILTALDALPTPEPAPLREPARAAALPVRGLARHPFSLVAGALIILVFGVVIGLNAGRFTEPAPTTMQAPGGPLGPDAAAEDSPVGPPAVTLDPGKPVPPAMLAGMLSAARQSLMAGRYGEAIAAYRAVLKRDPRNVDAMTHLGLIVAIGGHADAAIDAFDKVARIDPDYAPMYLYRGQVLYEVKQDYAGAVQAWQRFLALVPSGEDHQRVTALVREAQDKQRSR